MTDETSKNAQADSPIVSVRIPRATLDKLDAFIGRQKFKVSRASVILGFLESGLDAEEQAERRARRGAARGGAGGTGGDA